MPHVFCRWITGYILLGSIVVATDGAATESGCADCLAWWAQVENEPDCGVDYVDLFNGGCNSTPSVFLKIEACDICGKTGGFLDQGMPAHDTDWYIFEATRPALFSGIATVPLRISVQERGCPSATIATSTSPACVPTPVIVVQPGSYVLVVTVDGFGPEFPCGSNYSIVTQGLDFDCGGFPVDDATWGGIKALYNR